MDVLWFVIRPNSGSNKPRTRRRSVDIHSLNKPSHRHERCIVTCKKTAYIFLSCAVIFLFIFLFYSFPHTSSKCVCVTLEAHQSSAFVGLQWAHGKRPTVCWEKESFLPGTLFILCLCGNITDFALLFCICPILATSRHFAHRIHSNPPTAQGVQSLG